MTATVRIGLSDTEAHFIPQSALVLDDVGILGVRVVDAESSQVVFKEITQVRDNSEGVWVRGLLPQEDIIILGQNYVEDGQKVDVKVVTPDQLP